MSETTDEIENAIEKLNLTKSVVRLNKEEEPHRVF
jgi:hypothetical protein